MMTLFRRYGASNCTGSTHNHICTSVYMPESIGVGSIQGLGLGICLNPLQEDEPRYVLCSACMRSREGNAA